MKPKILIVTARYYKNFSENLEFYASVVLNNKAKYKFVSVPGVFEIPVVISKNIKKYDAFLALGCVIKGETPHFDFISQATTQAIMSLSIEHKKPIGNGIITSLNKKQAFTRSKKKGQEAAKAVLSVLKNF
jgi:6,7-dimethyl-8-ribityllumazine synthase|tara:strand:+ start:48 stop:440 length:393 start_codon:yes stop_codon:yes gene_type:complete